ncbi:MAG: 4Fe-4S double cluster binding domain-containing protein [Thermoleophilia bacterium]
MASDETVRDLEARGWRAAVTPVSRLADLRAEIESRQADMAPAVTTVVGRNLDDAPPRAVRTPRSLIVVAVPHACARVTVVAGDEEIAVPIPTTYCHHDEIRATVAATLAASLGAVGLSAALMRLPEKLLAVCAGLARYGRNNIAYVDGWGSFVELVACVSDLAPGPDPWTGPRLLPRCDSCEACRHACPTGAIGEDRFLLHGERCLTLLNESGRPFPDWLDPAWHHCLWGCLRCQRACPEDRAVRDEIAETAAFDERETGLLLRGIDHGLLEREPLLRDKLGDLGLLGYDDAFLGVALARNLGALLGARSRRVGAA